MYTTRWMPVQVEIICIMIMHEVYYFYRDVYAYGRRFFEDFPNITNISLQQATGMERKGSLIVWSSRTVCRQYPEIHEISETFPEIIEINMLFQETRKKK